MATGALLTSTSPCVEKRGDRQGGPGRAKAAHTPRRAPPLRQAAYCFRSQMAQQWPQSAAGTGQAKALAVSVQACKLCQAYDAGPQQLVLGRPGEDHSSATQVRIILAPPR